MVISTRKLGLATVAVLVALFGLQIPAIMQINEFKFLYERIPVFMAILLLAVVLLKYRSLSPVTGLLLVYYLMLAVISHWRGWGIPLVLTKVCPSICMILLCEYLFKKDRILMFRTLGVLMCALAVVDLITMFIHPEGMYTAFIFTNNWFLGYKTERFNIALPGVVFLCEYSIMRYGRPRYYVWIMAAVVIAAAFWSDATAAAVSMLFFVALLALVFWRGKKAPPEILSGLLRPDVVLIVLLAASFLIAFVQNLSLFEFIIVNILNKNMNLTGRTNIWNVCEAKFLDHPLLGNGYINPSYFAVLTGTVAGTQPHNLLWTLLVYTGLVGTVIYMAAVFLAFAKIGKKYSHATYVMACYVLSNFLLGISSMNNYAPMFTAAISLIWHLGRSEEAAVPEKRKLSQHYNAMYWQ